MKNDMTKCHKDSTLNVISLESTRNVWPRKSYESVLLRTLSVFFLKILTLTYKLHLFLKASIIWVVTFFLTRQARQMLT